MVKRPPGMQKSPVQSLGQEDSPAEGTDEALQSSCLENPMDRGAWRAAVHGVAKSLKRSICTLIEKLQNKRYAKVSGYIKDQWSQFSPTSLVIKFEM